DPQMPYGCDPHLGIRSFLRPGGCGLPMLAPTAFLFLLVFILLGETARGSRFRRTKVSLVCHRPRQLEAAAIDAEAHKSANSPAVRKLSLHLLSKDQSQSDQDGCGPLPQQLHEGLVR